MDRKKIFRKCEEVSIPCFKKSWVDIYIQNLNSSNKTSKEILIEVLSFIIFNDNEKAVVLLINMSDDVIEQNSKNVVKGSSIKFQTSLLELNHPSKISQSLTDRISSSYKSISKVSSSYGEDISNILDPKICYHPQCSFVYNITGDVRRDSLIAQCLPPSTYKRLAELWGLDPEKTPRLYGNTCKMQNAEEEDAMVDEYIKSVERDLGIRSDISEDLQVNAESIKRNQVKSVETKPELKENPYLKFLKKDQELNIDQINKSNLRKKAKKITKMIIKNFLDWCQSLGGHDNEALIDEVTLQELFQIGFEFPAAKAMVIRIKEMPTVPDCLAILRNEPKHSTSYGLRKYLEQDIKKENLPPRMFAFGSMLPKEKPSLRYKPPRNFVKKTWLECSRVPSELDTMKTIWTGLERLRSTIAFSTWLKNHPEVKPPIYLLQKGLLEINYEEWNQMYKGFEMDVDNLDVVAATSEKISVKESKLSVPVLENFGSVSSFL